MALLLIGFTTLPLTFGPLVPVSHFLFETSSKQVFWVFLAFTIVLYIALCGRVAVQNTAAANTTLFLLTVGILICNAIWLVSIVMLSDYEQGISTPELWSSTFYVLDWLAAIVICVLAAILGWPTKVLAPKLLFCIILLLVSGLVVSTGLN